MTVRVFFLTLMLLFSLNGVTATEPSLSSKRVLVLFSYHPTFPTADQVRQGLADVFPQPSAPIIDLEFMDTKRHFSDAGLAIFKEQLALKLSQRPPYDLLITADDNALTFALEHHASLFNDIPVVFLGVNNKALALAQNTNPFATGVVEDTSMEETVELIQSVRPNLNTLYVISDGTTSGSADLNAFLELQPEFDDLMIQVINLEVLSWSDLTSTVAQIPRNNGILLLSAYEDRTGERRTFEAGIQSILTDSAAPVFHLWEHGIGDGLAGGIIISHREQARTAARMAESILKGRLPEDIPVVDISPNLPVFDARVLSQYGIDFSDLPRNSEIRFQTTSFYQQYRRVLMSGVVVILSLIVIIVILVRQNRQRMKLSQQLRDREQMLNTVVDNVDAYIYMKDPNSRYLFVNKKVADLFRQPVASVIGKPDRLFFPPNESRVNRDSDLQVLRSGSRYQVEETNKLAGDDELHTFLTTKLPLKNEDGDPYAICGISVDITDRKKIERQLEILAHTDQLTGLPNRVAFADRLQQAMALAARSEMPIAVLYLDLDGFKEINDQQGHDIGDELLQAFSVRLRTLIRGSDMLARLGGDEFVVMLTNDQSPEGDVMFAERLLATVKKPFVIRNKMVSVSASIGITRYPQAQSIDADQLLRQADQAMYTAKTLGRNRFHFFNTDHERRAVEQIQLIERVEQALKNDEFELYFQPQIEMPSGKIMGAEALVRWNDPQRGVIMPGEFLPDIEDADVSSRLDEWVARAAMRQLMTWGDQFPDLSISINISHLHLGTPRFFQMLDDLFLAYPDVHPTRLKIEILESKALDNMELASAVIAQCSALGVQFALDDFGTGYSSLSYLKQLPIRQIKIDRTFVRDMLEDADDRAILLGIQGLGDAFALDVVVEGVETIEHGVALRDMGFTRLQGYAIGHPMAAGAFADWVYGWTLPEVWR